MSDQNTKIYFEPGGDTLVVAHGGKLSIQSGGEIEAAIGSTVDGIVAASAATTEVAGKVELATDAEAITGTDDERAVTPAALAAAATTHVTAASAIAAGKVELATDAETIAVTDAERAVTPHGLGAALAKLFVISFTGSNLAGACTAVGVAVGDVLFEVAGLTDMGVAGDKFEAIVTVDDQIQQTAAENLSAKNYLALVYRPA